MSFVLVDRPVPEVAVVTLNRPERMNAMAFDVMVPFGDALVELGQHELADDPRAPDDDALHGFSL